MKFICLGYLDESSWESMPEDERLRFMDECFDYHDALLGEGYIVGGEALDSARNAVTLRMKDGAVEVTDGPYAETKEMLAGFSLLEARDLAHAIELLSKHPGVRAGPFEIRAADEDVGKLYEARQAARDKPD